MHRQPKNRAWFCGRPIPSPLGLILAVAAVTCGVEAGLMGLLPLLEPLPPGLASLLDAGATTLLILLLLACFLFRPIHQLLEQRQQTQTALEISEAKYRQIVENAQEGIWMLDAQARTSYVNQTMAQMLGYTVEGMLGRPLFDFMDAAACAEAEQHFARRKQGLKDRFDFRFRRQDGTELWTLLATNPLFDPAGRFTGALALISDITERVRAEQELRRERDLVGCIAETSPVSILLLDPEGRIVFANQQAQTVLGLSRNELTGVAYNAPAWHITDLAGDPLPDEALPFRRVLATGKPVWHVQHAIKRAGDERVLLAINAAPVLDEAGRVRSVVVALEDITERQHTEILTRATTALLRLHSTKASRKEYLDGLIGLLQGWSSCRCIGIRILDEQGRIPCEAFVGFSQPFWTQENWLLLHRNCCVCTRVLLGQPEPQEAAALTPGGSFCTGRLSEFAKALSPAQAAHFCGACLGTGFESLAVIPIRYQDQVLGAIHLADERPDRLPPKGIAFLEALAPLIGPALHRQQLEEALRESEQNLLKAQQIAHVGYWDRNLLTNQSRWSAETFRIFGLAPRTEALPSGFFLQHVHPEDRPRVAQALADVLQGLRPYAVEFRGVRPDGTLRSLYAAGEISCDASGRPLRFFGTVTDLTERKQAEEALRASEASLVEAERLAHLGSYEFAVPDGPVKWSAETFHIVGRAPARGEPTVAEYMQTVHPDDRHLVDQVVEQAVREQRRFTCEYRIVLPDGSLKHVQSVGRPVTNAEGRVVRIFGTLMDITERKAAENELRASREQLRALAARIQAVREEERSRMAREIHDVLAQELTRLQLDIAWLQRRLARPLAPVEQKLLQEKLGSMTYLTDRAIEAVQKIATELRPVVLDSLGLHAAIEWQVKDFQARTGLDCSVRLPQQELALDRERSTALFRILQESLTNVARHAAATRVETCLQQFPQHLTLTIRDNGRGIEPAQLQDPRSVGLLGMRERAALLDGQCDITGIPGRGTLVEVRLPVPPPHPLQEPL